MIETYHAVYFEDVGSAVGFCHDLVPYVAPRAAALLDDDARPVVWFHVPHRSTDASRAGCYLLLNSGALRAALEIGLDVPVSGNIARASLPPEAVLVFGDDSVVRHAEMGRRRRTRAPRAARAAESRGSAARHPATIQDLIATPS